MLAVKLVVHGLVEFIQNFSKKNHDTPQVCKKKQKPKKQKKMQKWEKKAQKNFLSFSLSSPLKQKLHH